MNTFKNLRVGQYVNYLIPNGLSIKNGQITQDWKLKRSRVVMAFENHVVVNGGGRFGNPRVVDENNYLS